MTRKNKITLVLMLILGGLIMWYSMRKVPFENLMVDIFNLRWEWLLVAVLCMLISFGIEAVVVQLLLKEKHADFGFKNALRVPLIEQLFNGITPFATGGQPAQLFALVQSGVDAGKATSILLMKFIVYQAMIVVNFVFCLLLGFHYLESKLHVLALLVIFGFLIHFTVIIGLLLVMYWYKFTKKMVHICLLPLKLLKNKSLYPKWEEKIDVKIDSFYQESLRLKEDKMMIFKICILTLIQLMFYYVIPYFILLALGITHANILMVTTLHVLIVMVISLFPIPGGTGGAEYSFSIIFAAFLHGGAKLVLAMILWRLITYYLGMFCGIVALVVKPQKKRS